MEEKKKLYQKWWFWICIVLLALIVGFVVIMIVAFNTATSGISGVAMQIQNISENTTLYSSAGGKSLILQIDHYDNLKNGDLNKMLDIIKANSNTVFSNYSKLIVLNYFDSDEGQKNYMLLIKEFSMPDFVETNSLNYIDYSMYEEMFKNYSDAMDGYTNLFKSIY